MKKNASDRPNAHARAFQSWFSAFERERKRRRIAPGRKVPGFLPPPPGPAELADLIDALGESAVLRLLGVHRSTVARWRDGSSRFPPAAFHLLRIWSEGRLPGMGDDWRDFRFEGDALVMPGTRWRFTARELAGVPYLQAHIGALERKISDLQKQNGQLLRLGDFGAANDAIAL